MRVFVLIQRCFVRNYVMFFQTVICIFQRINTERYSMSDNDNKIGSLMVLAMFLFNNNFLLTDCCILFITTLQKQNAAPRFPLVSFCRCCSAPAVFLRFRFKNRACFIQASKRIPLQSLSEETSLYTCTHSPPYRRNWL
mgnify:CR=1 FL=1